MANQAFSLSEDLLVGAGEIWFSRDGDTNGLHHLGNCEEMNFTVDVTKQEKNSSMNKKRTLMNSVTTAVKPKVTITLDEYNSFNVALGLYGNEYVTSQAAKTVVDEEYTVLGVPSVIRVKDADGNGYYEITDVAVKPQATVPAVASFVSVSSSLGALSMVTKPNDTYTDVLGGKIKIEAGTFAGTEDERIFFNVKTAPTAAGSVAGLVLDVKEGVVGVTQEFTATTGASETFTTTGGIKFTVTLGSSDKLTVFPAGTLGEAKVVAAMTAYVNGKDYVCSTQDLQAGIIRIKETSGMAKGDIVKVSYKVPERQSVDVSIGDAGDITGSILYTSDNNSGPNTVIECWRVKISPDGDFSGIISDNFGTFKITGDLLDSSDSYPDYPYAKVTTIGRTGADSTTKGTYDPKW